MIGAEIPWWIAVPASLFLIMGGILAQRSPRQVIPWLALTCMAAIACLLLPSAYGGLLVLMLAYGVAAAVFDVAINDEATAIERASGRALMSGFHGMFSVGGMAGAASWSLVAEAGASPGQHLAGAAAVLGLLGCAASRFMLRQQRQISAYDVPCFLVGLFGLRSVELVDRVFQKLVYLGITVPAAVAAAHALAGNSSGSKKVL